MTDIRPNRLKDFIGQDKLKTNLMILIGAARLRGEVLEHVLFYGPPGLGKTTLAQIIATEMGTNATITSGPAIKKPVEIAEILLQLKHGDILFIDEIHRLRRDLEEVLYPAMEDGYLDIIMDKRAHRLQLQPFTLVGATTRRGMLTAPMRARFGAVYHLELYDNQTLAKIISRSAHVLGCTIDEKAALELAKRSRGTPRIANRFLKRARDYTQIINKSTHITTEAANNSLLLQEIDQLGLDNLDRKVLRTIIDNFNGGPVGLSTLIAALGEEKDTITEIIEPYLIQLGLIERQSRGRIATTRAYQLLGKG
jgi:Holliday junction DNA helicase RuvB